jgi:DNA-binding beta-propeller fold protein YncE
MPKPAVTTDRSVRAIRAWLFILTVCLGLTTVAWTRWPSRASDARLVGEQPLDGATCPLPDWLESTVVAAQQTGAGVGGNIKPIRTVNDPYPTFAGIAVDPVNQEVVVSDENRFSLVVYDRKLDMAGVAEAKRRISGHNTHMEFICGVTVDPQNREIYTVNNDTMDTMVVFGPDARGNVTPSRELNVDHGSWGLFLDKKNDEIAITTQHINKISIYRRTASGKEAPLRILQGPSTVLADPHGVYIDSKNDEIVVANHGSWHLERTDSDPRWYTGNDIVSSLIPSTGRIDLPSISVFARTAKGDTAPIRRIQGAKTGLNLPSGVAVDDVRNEIVVANDGGNAVLIFSRTASGDVAPIRKIAGPATGLKNPSGVSIDVEHDELWVSNWGDHSANVYARSATGNVAPLRTIRSAPRGAPMPGMGNPGAVAYDPRRDQLLVPN